MRLKATNPPTIIAGDSNTYFSVNKIKGTKLRSMENWNNSINKLDLGNNYTRIICTIFLSAHSVFLKIDYIPGHKIRINKY